jgi:hypothetical protein
MGTKICRCCGIEQDLHSGFYIHARMADGYLNKCKECVKNRVKVHRKENDHVRAYDRFRYYNDPKRNESNKLNSKLRYLKNPEKVIATNKRWILRNPEKRAAHIAVGNAVRDGKLIRQPCVVCGELKVHAHHTDYSKKLDVIWLCKDHHMKEHRKYDQ